MWGQTPSASGIDFEYVRADGDGDSLGALIASVSRHGGMSVSIR